MENIMLLLVSINYQKDLIQGRKKGNMQTVKFVTTDDTKVYVWCTTNRLDKFRNFLQYILDNANNPEDFYVIDVKKNLVYNAYNIATEMYHMRKRTFDERMDNIQTGKWVGFDVTGL